MSKKQYIGIIILAVMILGFLFYWYEFRPYQIKKGCSKEFFHTGRSLDAREFFYKVCLKGKGF